MTWCAKSPAARSRPTDRSPCSRATRDGAAWWATPCTSTPTPSISPATVWSTATASRPAPSPSAESTSKYHCCRRTASRSPTAESTLQNTSGTGNKQGDCEQTVSLFLLIYSYIINVILCFFLCFCMIAIGAPCGFIV